MASTTSSSPSSTTITPTATPSPIPPPVPVETHPNRNKVVLPHQVNDATLLDPKASSPPRIQSIRPLSSSTTAALRPAVASLRQPPAIPPVAARLEAERNQQRTPTRKPLYPHQHHHHHHRKPHVWKRLLWVKQPGYPDNYTDPATFLDKLQRNPKLRPYEFWPLVADSLVIVQHLAALVVFVSAYAGIYQDRLSPVAVVGLGTAGTLGGWYVWDMWEKEEQEEREESGSNDMALSLTSKPPSDSALDEVSLTSNQEPFRDDNKYRYENGHAIGNGHVVIHNETYRPDGLTASPAAPSERITNLSQSLSTSNLAAQNHSRPQSRLHSETNQTSHAQSLSKSSWTSISSIEPINEADRESTPIGNQVSTTNSTMTARHTTIPCPATTITTLRNRTRLKTFKSALLIYFALLGLSPILKSLTKSTSSDSIWALATWLLIINIFFFDYGSQYIPTGSSRRRSITSPETRQPRPSPTPKSAVSKPCMNKVVQPTTDETSSSSITEPSDIPAVATATALATTTPLTTTVRNTSATKTVFSRPRALTANTTPITALHPQPAPTSYPSSLSTNAAVMASTVLASRLATTTAVFSLTLFSIQIFGLFPLFRRHLRAKSFQAHTWLTLSLVVTASAGLGLILSRSYTHTYGECGYCWGWIGHVVFRGVLGVVVGGSVVVVAMGGCAWWLITLQRYKNVVVGPWDPARPILAGGLVGRARGNS